MSRAHLLRRAVAAAALVLLACSRPTPPPPPPPGPDITLEQVTLRNYRGSSLTLVARAPRVEVLRATMDLWATDAALELSASGTVVTARAVTGNLQSGHLEGRDGVVLQTRDGVEGRSPAVTYERDEGAQGGAHSDAGVQVTHPRFTHQADGFSVDFAEQRAEFTHPRTVARPAPESR